MQVKWLFYVLLICVVFVMPASIPAEETAIERTVLFQEETDGIRLFRIPGIVVTARGTALAYCEARKFTVADRGEIEIHLRRSTDGGRTWDAPRQIAHLGPRLPRNPHMPADKHGKDLGGPNEQTVNNPMGIAARDGTVHFVYCVEYMRCFYMQSEDDGVTWSRPSEITSAFDAFRSQCNWQAIATGPGHGIELQDGRLVVPVWIATYTDGSSIRKASSVIYSDDAGRTWHAGGIAIVGGGEANVAGLADGRVMLTARNSDPRDRRAVTFSPDGAGDWSPVEFADELLEPGCMAGLVEYRAAGDDGRPMHLFSSLHTTEREHKERKDLTITVSYDGGRTWPVARLLQSGPSAYSDLAVLPDGSILCFHESGTPKSSKKYKRPWQYSCLVVAKFGSDWLTDENER